MVLNINSPLSAAISLAIFALSPWAFSSLLPLFVEGVNVYTDGLQHEQKKKVNKVVVVVWPKPLSLSPQIGKRKVNAYDTPKKYRNKTSLGYEAHLFVTTSKSQSPVLNQNLQQFLRSPLIRDVFCETV